VRLTAGGALPVPAIAIYVISTVDGMLAANLGALVGVEGAASVARFAAPPAA
jgi:hypothetical protein